ncbi:MAG: TraB/GumN family protein [Pseudomonadota bacterium]
MHSLFKITAAAALSLIVVGCGEQTAQDEQPPALPEGVSVPIGGPGRPTNLTDATSGESNVALWQVSDEDTVVYLLGTVHLMKTGTSWETDAIRAAFNQSEATYLEADVWSKDAQRAMGVVVTQNAENAPGNTLSGFFDKKQRAKLDETVTALGMTLSDIELYRPWFATMQLSVLALVEAGGDPAAGADIYISREMMLRDTPLRYLETAAQQIKMLSSGDDTRDAEYLYASLEDLSKGEIYFADLVGAWYDGDVERLDFLVNGAMADFPELRQRLLVDRNLDWAQQIDRLMTDEPGTYLVAVGVGHLVGEGSVQDQLASRGYEPKRID